ncbi:MAG: serine hydrolase domain-containing protein [Kiritimatiellia bacterium]
MKSEVCCLLAAVASGSVLLSGCVTPGRDEPKARVDAAMASAFEQFHLEYMNVAFEQHGELRYQYVRKADAVRPGRGKDPSAPFDANTPLHVASITKVMTSVLVVQLVEEGKVSLLDPIRLYVPEFPDDEVTVRDLMVHASGYHSRAVGYRQDPGKFYGSVYRIFDRGTTNRYFSAGYDVLADMIERVTGADDVADVARVRIFAPLGMAHTTFAPHCGRSGMRTTAPDLVRFGREILTILRTRRSGILTPAGVDLLLRPVNSRPEFFRTCAFFVKSGQPGFSQYFADLNSMRAVGHAGATGCYLLIDPDYDAVQVILTNSETNEIQRKDTNFSRLNAVMLANLADSPMGAYALP